MGRLFLSEGTMMNLILAFLLSQNLPPDSLEKVHAMIRPAAEEAPWTGVSWMTSLWQARERAAREGKPLLIWAAGGGGHPLALC